MFTEEQIHNHLGWVGDLLTHFSYKPGWTFEARPVAFALGHYDVCVRFEFVTPNSYRPEELIRIASNERVPSYVIGKPEKFAHWFQHALFSVERHESREWFRVDGEVFDDPHK